ncbi:MAG: ATPase [Alphaproteobacteria bacterium]|nr:ATPase [Alphaproteobacteria bacterium]
MTTHAPTIAFSGTECLDIDVEVQIASGLPASNRVGPFAPKHGACGQLPNGWKQ